MISWLNCKSIGIGILAPHIVALRDMLYSCWQSLNFGATAPGEQLCTWTPREYNKTADALATTGIMDGNRYVHRHGVRGCSRFFRIHFDGGHRKNTMGGGWYMEQAWGREGASPHWQRGPGVALRIPAQAGACNAITAELVALRQ